MGRELLQLVTDAEVGVRMERIRAEDIRGTDHGRCSLSEQMQVV